MTITQSQFRTAMLDASTDIPKGLLDAQGRDAGRRFNVYRNNVAVSLTDALETGFPVIAKLIGQENFRAIAGVFLRQHPPASPVMMFYGAEFPAFLRNFEPLQHLGYLGDVAKVEMALRHAYHAEDAQAIAPDALAQISPEDLPNIRMSIAPSVQVLSSPWPIYDLWAYNSIEGHPKPQAGAQDMLITRVEFDPLPHLLPSGSVEFIAALRGNATLSEATEQTTKTYADFDLGAVLGLLLTGNAITSITHEDSQ